MLGKDILFIGKAQRAGSSFLITPPPFGKISEKLMSLGSENFEKGLDQKFLRTFFLSQYFFDF